MSYAAATGDESTCPALFIVLVSMAVHHVLYVLRLQWHREVLAIIGGCTLVILTASMKYITTRKSQAYIPLCSFVMKFRSTRKSQASISLFLLAMHSNPSSM